MSRKAISDMLIICKSAAYNLAETEDFKQETLNAGHECAKQYRELLLLILQGNGSSDVKQTLPIFSRKIAQSVTELLSVAKRLKGMHVFTLILFFRNYLLYTEQNQEL